MNTRVYAPPSDCGLAIIYQDESFLVLDKPAGLLSVPGRGDDKQDCLASRVQSKFPEALIVHRLDMDTSGIILMARNPSAQRELGHLFEMRSITKKYLAVVSGQLSNSTGEIDLPLTTDWPNRPRQIVDHQHGKPAKTGYRVVNYNKKENTTRVELFPETGRSHQLRVHMQALGHPVIGDKLYASADSANGAGRLMLHATSLTFKNPFTGELMAFTSPAPF